MDLVLRNVRIVGEDGVTPGSVAIAGGRIAAVTTARGAGGMAELAPAPGAIIEDCAGDYLIPGLVDLHTDHLEFHAQPRAGVPWPGVAAAMAHDAQVAAAGITTVFDSLALMGGRRGENRRAMLRPIVEGLTTARDRGMLRV